MARKATGTITPAVLADGSTAFHLRFRAYGQRERDTLHERRDCACGCGGGWTERTAQVELENTLAKIQAGIWKPGQRAQIAAATAPRRTQTFHEYASYWLAAKRSGGLGSPISDNSHARLLWALRHHLLPFFAKYRLDEIDRDLCLAFKERKLTEADELAATIAAGAKLRHRNGRKIRPLSASSISDVIGTLAQVLDDAVEDGHIASNPARGKRMRLHVPKPTRSFLEQDELALLLDTAGILDQASAVPQPATVDGKTAGRVAELAAAGKRPSEIAAALKLSRPTVSYHLKRLDVTPAEPYVGRRAIAATLGYAGPRVSELCDLRVGHLRLHDPAGARFRVTDSKTPTGIREVEISPTLVEVLVEHIDRLRRAGLPTGPDAYAFPNTRGGRMSRQRAAKLLREAATAATGKAQESGLPPLPNVTPHTLRRTYVSIALLASSFDIKWVMSQVGHADSAMTLDVYAQLQQRHQRQHGQAFDQLIRDARTRLYGTHLDPNGTRNGTQAAPDSIEGALSEWSQNA